MSDVKTGPSVNWDSVITRVAGTAILGFCGVLWFGMSDVKDDLSNYKTEQTRVQGETATALATTAFQLGTISTTLSEIKSGIGDRYTSQNAKDDLAERDAEINRLWDKLRTIERTVDRLQPE